MSWFPTYFFYFFLFQNDIVRKREESNADVAAYKKEKAANANKQLYTKEFVQLEMAK